MNSIEILGKTILLQAISKVRLKGLSVGTKLAYNFYDGEVLGMSMIFLEPKADNPTPRTCLIVAKEVKEKFKNPVVFLLSPAPFVVRTRFIEKGVYFVMSTKFSHLPMLVVNEVVSNRKKAERLTPVAQYLLLYHLQVSSIEGKSAKDIAKDIPYSYESTTLGITCLNDLGLCEKVADGPKRKVVHFNIHGRELWQAARKYTINPVDQRFYCDELYTDEEFPTSGINALAHYTRLVPDRERMVMMAFAKYKELQKKNAFVGANQLDGNIIVEVWKYPPVSADGFVDKLSLSLTLANDNDARVESEVEKMIAEMSWQSIIKPHHRATLIKKI